MDKPANWLLLFLEAFLITVISIVGAPILVFLAPWLMGVLLSSMYLPGFHLFGLVFDAVPYKGWVVSAAYFTCAVTSQNIVMWALVRFVPRKSKYSEN